MKIKIQRPVTWATILCALALAGCDSVKDVRSGPFTPLPAETEVLKGVVNGLGGGRAITLQYTSDVATANSFLGAQPAVPSPEPDPVPFSFGSLVAGTQYNVIVTGQPFGKTCVPASGASGTIERGQETNVVINCTPSIPRYDLTVMIPQTDSVFRGLPGARVILTTGEQIRLKYATEAVLVGDHYELTFPGALFNAAGQPSAFTWSVSAAFTDLEGREGRCQVTRGTNPTNPTNPPAPAPPVIPPGDPRGSPGGPQQPTGHISSTTTSPIIGLALTQTTSACQFTISGSVAYSTPPGGTAPTGAIPGGLLLEVRDRQANVKASYEVTSYGNFTFKDQGGNDALFSSTEDSIYDIAVKRHPTGLTCVVGDGGAASLYRTGIFNPVNISPTADVGGRANSRAWGSRLNVFCRAVPTAQKKLSGTFRPTKWVYTPVPPAAQTTLTYDNYDISKHNAGSSDMLTLFDDGTFLFGTHAQITFTPPSVGGVAGWESGIGVAGYSVQVEHGFYDYEDPDNNPATPNGTLRFTIITDTNPTGVFPTTFGAVQAPTSSAGARNGTAGLSAMPGPAVTGTPTAGAGIGIWHAVMNNVQKTTFTFGQGINPNQTLSRITGVFGTSPSVEWTVTEPQSVDNEMTGAWISQDHRRFWVWDYLTNYGMHVGVLGGAPSLNDACYTMLDVRASSGIYTRRGSNTGCYPLDRPRPGATFTLNFVQSIDFHLTDVTLQTNTFKGVSGLHTAAGTHVVGSRLDPQFGTPTNAIATTAVLPGYIGRIPGGQTASDGRSPSPTLFLIAPASTFAAKVASTFYTETGKQAAVYFDDPDEIAALAQWCQSDILAIRATLNGLPINYPVYLCRNRAL